MNYDYIIPGESALSLLSTQIRGDCWCMLNRNDTITTFPQDIATTIANGIPAGLQFRKPCIWEVSFPWRPFTPAAGHDRTNIPWFFDSCRSSYYDLDAVRADVFSVCNTIHEICNHYSEYRGPMPKFTEPISFASDDEFLRSKETMLEGLAFIAWWMAWFPDCLVSNKRNLSYSLIDSLKKWNLESPARHGIIFDLHQDIYTVNLPLWLTYCIPVFYQWTPAANDDRRFLKLSPSHFTTYHVTKPRFTFNDFLPEATSTSLACSSSKHQKARLGNFIIDFYGWKRRSIKSKSDAKKYFAKFPFTTVPTSEGSRALFWRWRTFSPSKSDPESDSESDSEMGEDLDPLEQLVAVRELYRFQHCPHSGTSYDPMTGLLLSSQGTLSSASTIQPTHKSSHPHRTSARVQGSAANSWPRATHVSDSRMDRAPSSSSHQHYARHFQSDNRDSSSWAHSSTSRWSGSSREPPNIRLSPSYHPYQQAFSREPTNLRPNSSYRPYQQALSREPTNLRPGPAYYPSRQLPHRPQEIRPSAQLSYSTHKPQLPLSDQRCPEAFQPAPATLSTSETQPTPATPPTSEAPALGPRVRLTIEEYSARRRNRIGDSARSAASTSDAERLRASSNVLAVDPPEQSQREASNDAMDTLVAISAASTSNVERLRASDDVGEHISSDPMAINSVATVQMTCIDEHDVSLVIPIQWLELKSPSLIRTSKRQFLSAIWMMYQVMISLVVSMISISPTLRYVL